MSNQTTKQTLSLLEDIARLSDGIPADHEATPSERLQHIFQLVQSAGLREPRLPSSNQWTSYPRRGSIDARPYVSGEDLSRVSVSPADRERPSLVGGMIARNPGNHDDQWYIAPEYFAQHYGSAPETSCELERLRELQEKALALDDAVAEFGIDKPQYIAEAYQAFHDVLHDGHGSPSVVKTLVEVRAFGTSIDPPSQKASAPLESLPGAEEEFDSYADGELHHRLVRELQIAHDRLATNQVELDAESKRILYRNVRSLYRR